MRTWRNIWGDELLAFAAGKTVARMDHAVYFSIVYFSDGSAIRCTAEDGKVYSSNSGDSATVQWEASAAP